MSPAHRAENPLDRQFKIRCTAADLEKIERFAHEGVDLPPRRIRVNGNKSDLVRQALGLDEPGKNALEELTRRVSNS